GSRPPLPDYYVSLQMQYRRPTNPEARQAAKKMLRLRWAPPATTSRAAGSATFLAATRPNGGVIRSLGRLPAGRLSACLDHCPSAASHRVTALLSIGFWFQGMMKLSCRTALCAVRLAPACGAAPRMPRNVRPLRQASNLVAIRYPSHTFS